MPENDSLSHVASDSSSFVLQFPRWEKLSRDSALQLRESISKEFDWGSGLHLHKIDRSQGHWLFAVLMLLLVVFTFLRVFYNNKYRQLIHAFVSSRQMKQVVREELALTHPFSIILLIHFALVTGLLLFWIDSLLPGKLLPFKGFLLFLAYSGIVLAVLAGKALLSKIAQFLIGEDGGMTENRYNMILFPELAGILMLPLVILASFGPESFFNFSLFTAAILLFITYLFRLIRGVVVALHAGSGVIYIFLYLCALEILPLIVMIRVLASEIGT